MKTRRGPVGRGPSWKSRSQTRPILERFEDRLLLTAFEVTNTADSGAGSLRQAILDSNGSTTALPNAINFDQLSAGLQTITPLSPLPAITQSVAIDGTTSVTYSLTSPKPVVEINGSNPMNTGGPGLSVNATGVSIKALVIDSFGGNGITLNGIGGLVSGCWIGLNPTGGVVAKNTGTGIQITASNSTIGGTTLADRNVISGNSVGINISSTSATANLIQGNFIGTDSSGLVKLSNTFDALDVGSGNNTIGGSSSIANNIISGAGNVLSAGFVGLNISGSSANGNVVQGNFIGTDATGLGSIPNIFEGLNINAVSNTLVGGSDPTLKNVISSNGFDGIDVSGAASVNTKIQGNYIGVAVNGFSPLGNGGYGINVNGAGNTLIGGTIPQGSDTTFGNIIANSGGTFTSDAGVMVQGAQNVGILSNRIFANAGLGIQLNAANQGVQPPTITSIQGGGMQTRISGTYFGLPTTTYRLQFFDNQSPDPSGSGEGMNFVGEFDITTNSVGNATFTKVVTGVVSVGDYISATATQGPLTVNNTSQFSPDVQATLAALTDLAVFTAPITNPPLLNQNFTYSITVSNNGPQDATGVVLTDTIPANSTFVSSSGGTFAAGVLTDNIGAIPTGGSVVVTITVKVNSIGTGFTNTAVVTGDQLDSILANNTSTSTSTVSSNADLSASLTASPNPAPVGSPLTYTLVIGNNGPSTANDATVTVTLPATLTNLIITPDQGTFSLAGNVLTINLGVLAASSSSTTTIIGTPSTTGSITTTAVVTSSLADVNQANNTASLTIPVANAADLALAITSAPNPVLTGQELFYTLTVTNFGPSTATMPVVTDQLPAGLTFVAADSNAGGNGTISIVNGVVTVTLNPLDSGGVDTITLAVIPTVSGQVSNTATVADPDTTNPAEIDSNLSNNSATTVTQVSPADVGVTILNPNDPLIVGNQVVYQILVSNKGPAEATNVILTDSFGSNGVIVGTSAGSVANGVLTANIGSLASGASTMISITVNPTASGNLIDSATVVADQLDPNPNNNSASSSNLVSPVDLAVSVSGAPNPILINNQVVYVVTVTNHGPTTATNVLFTDKLPGSSILNSATTSQGAVSGTTTGSVTGTLGSLAPGASATVTILVTINSVSTATDSATVTSDGFDTNTANNTGSASVSVINLPGTISVGTPLVFVPENAGFVTLTLDRSGGSLGAVSVNYATSDFSAVAGINYVASSGIVRFADGQTTATITIAVLDDGKVNGNNGFFVTLSNPTGGVALGTSNVAAVLVTNVDRDMIPPLVTGLIGIPNGSSLNGFVVSFDKGLDPARASLLSNYHVFVTNGGVAASGQSPVNIIAAIYSPYSDTVTLIPSAPIPANLFYHVVINGSFGLTLTDTSGNSLYGNSGVGSNYDVYYGQGTSLSYTDSQANKVAIKLTGGGTMGIFRGPNGDSATVNLYQVVPHRSKLAGSVSKLNKFSSGRTTINSITGLGLFGDVNSNLTTPPFYVFSAPVGITSLTGPTTATAASVTVNGKKTPRGPITY